MRIESDAAPLPTGAPHALSPTAPLVVALGGNAIGEARDRVTTRPIAARAPGSDEASALDAAAAQLADLAAEGHPLVLSHGNGPQVGRALARAALAEAEGQPPLPMDVAVAHTQGELGYRLARAIATALRVRELERPVVALLSQVAIDPADPALAEPSKPIGSWMSAVQAKRLSRTRGWDVRHLPPRGWRRVVPSPKPLAVLELPAIRALLDDDAIVVAGGGGGIPVVRDGPGYCGIAAVIDKDRSSALLARELDATALVMATNVPHVLLDYGSPAERPVHRMDAATATAHLAAGQFPSGSMGPKVEAALDFARATGRTAHICALAEIDRALAGEAGTAITA